MRQTRLVLGGVELAIRLPPVAHQDARVIEADHRRGLRETPPGLNGIHRGLRGHEGPEPPEVGRDTPARFIGRHDRTATHGRPQGLVRGLRVARRPANRVHQSAGGDGQPEALAPQARDPRIRQPEILVEHDGERYRLRAQLRGGRAERIGGLQRMPALPPAMSRATAPDVHVEAAHERSLDGQFFLILRGHASGRHGPGARRTLRGHRRLVGLIDVHRDPASALGSRRSG